MPLPWLAARAALALHPKSLRQIGSLGFSERTPEACTNLSCGRFVFFVGNGEGIETLAKPIFVRAQPFNGWHAPCLAGAPRALFIQNHCAKSGNWGFSERTLEACTNLSWEVRFLRERGGDRSIGGANLRKGQCPFNGSGTAAPRPPRTICCFAGLQKGRVRPAKGAPVF